MLNARFLPAILVKKNTAFFITAPFSHTTPRSDFIAERQAMRYIVAVIRSCGAALVPPQYGERERTCKIPDRLPLPHGAGGYEAAEAFRQPRGLDTQPSIRAIVDGRTGQWPLRGLDVSPALPLLTRAGAIGTPRLPARGATEGS